MNAIVNSETVEVGADTYRELLIGGTQRVKLIGRKNERAWRRLTHRRGDPFPFPHDADTFDEVHAYHQAQRWGRQGDYVTLFAQFTELWRVLKPNGVLCMTVPSPNSDWVWGDPGNSRAITNQTINYLIQPEYEKLVGISAAMVDYRDIYKADFEPEMLQDDGRELRIILRAVKPSRCSV